VALCEKFWANAHYRFVDIATTLVLPGSARFERGFRRAPWPLQQGAQLQRPTAPAPSLVHRTVAVLDAGFRADRRIREFAAPDLDGLEQFAPQILVIRLDAALQLADQKLRGLLTLASVDFALIVLTRTEDTPLAQHHRDLLWEAFGVPVFEQLQDAEGRVIARECEVHDGLHLEAGCSAPAGLDCEMLREQCECGAETPRLKPKMVRERAAAAAA
jgi:hypothetical protein